MDEVRRGELHRLMDALVDVSVKLDTPAADVGKYGDARSAIVRWVEARELEAYERGASTQARLMAWAPRKGAGDE